MGKTTATQRTLAYLREHDWTCQVVEKWVRYGAPKEPEGTNTPGRKSPGVRVDLFGFIDIVAIKRGSKILAVQCFTTDWEGHVRKLLDTPAIREAAMTWANAGDVVLMGWRLTKPRGQKVPKWRPRIGVLRLPAPGVRHDPIIEEITEYQFNLEYVPI